MSARTSAPPRQDQALLDRIGDRVRDLVDPSTTSQSQWVPSDDGARLEPRVHTIEHPSLVAQLELAVAGGTAGASGGGFESRPAANLEALDALQTMRREVAAWVRIAFRTRPSWLSDDLRLVSSRAHELDRDDAGLLDADVLRWWARARIVTTWDSAPLKLFVPCMVCDARGKVRVTLDPLAAMCLECGSAWDDSTVGILGEHIRLAMGVSIADRRAQPRRTGFDFARLAERLEWQWREHRALGWSAGGLPGIVGRELDTAEVVDLRDLAAAYADLAGVDTPGQGVGR